MGKALQYGLVITLVAVGVIYGATVLSQALTRTFNTSAACIQDQTICK